MPLPSASILLNICWEESKRGVKIACAAIRVSGRDAERVVPRVRRWGDGAHSGELRLERRRQRRQGLLGLRLSRTHGCCWVLCAGFSGFLASVFMADSPPKGWSCVGNNRSHISAVVQGSTGVGRRDPVGHQPLRAADAMALLEEAVVHEGLASKLLDNVRDAACSLLIDVLGHGKHAANNPPLINKLFGKASGTPHCHVRNGALEMSVLREYRCITCMLDDSCIATAVYRHVPLPRRAASDAQKHTELLLLAVEDKERRKGVGSALATLVKVCSAAAGSSSLVVVANEKTAHIG